MHYLAKVGAAFTMNKSDLRLAQAGDVEAQYRLYRTLYFSDKAEDVKEAAKWRKKAAEQGHASAQNELADSYQGASWRLMAEGRFELGDSHLNEILVQNQKDFISWHTKAAEQGHRHSQYELGNAYRLGDGLSKDMQEALRWYLKAAEQGYPLHQIQVAEIYKSGDGVPKNTKEALEWYLRAAEQGSEWAMIIIAAGLRNGELPKNLKESLKWHLIMANEGQMDSQYCAGMMYLDGEGTPESYIDAYAWLSLAKTQGHEFADNELEALKPKMTNQQIADGQALAARHYDSIHKDCD